MNKDITKYVGIDIGDRTSMIHVLNQEGEFIEETRVPTTATALQRKFGDQPRMRIAIEVGGHSRWVTRIKSSGAWQMCYPKVDKTLGAHTWGLSAWDGRLRPWDAQSSSLSKPVGLLGHPADI
jgi:hypothetical protein